MKIFNKIFVAAIVISIFGCAPQIGYRFSLMKPMQDQGMVYSDEKIDIRFAMSETWYKGVEGMKQYDNYDGISFLLKNKTNEVITIDWNKVSFKDYTGSSGNAVMHKGIKYIDCSSIKNPTVVPPKGQLNDIITPCYAVALTASRWQIHMLSSPRKMPTADFGFFIPIRIGEIEHNYVFEFRAVSQHAP